MPSDIMRIKRTAPKIDEKSELVQKTSTSGFL